MEKDNDEDSLNYHSLGKPGKIEVNPTKPCITARDLSLAYTPGVAAPCLEIEKNPDDIYTYTSKGNLVAVISNGTAVLGLGNIGAAASKPVMEGKGILFKRFAGIDVFDIEINESDPKKLIDIISSLEPTFGGINLEDIKAPECFEIEKALTEKMNIPVFHDDQHGTAIICSAGLINALEIQKKKIDKVKIVFSGAGAAAMACARLFFEIGVKRENVIMCDTVGAIFKGREEGMNPYKEEFAIKTSARSMDDALKDADVFVGVSKAGALKKEMVKKMADRPIIFALANPTPEIFPHEVEEVRTDAIIATGRSDFPNQVNNVLCFPFLFRGALDVRAKKINLEMKLAAVKALSELAREDVPEEVKMAYQNEQFKFGKTYIIPKPFDGRILERLAPAVAKAAMESKVARIEIKDLAEYARGLKTRLGSKSAQFTESLRVQLEILVKQKGRKIRILFADGSEKRILKAVNTLVPENIIEPILMGDSQEILKTIEESKLKNLNDVKIIDPIRDENFETYWKKYYKKRQRKGVTKTTAKDLMAHVNYFGCMMVDAGEADGVIEGPTLTFPECFSPILQIIGTKERRKSCGIYIFCFKNRILFLADTTTLINPTEKDLESIAVGTAKLYQKLIGKNPKIAFLSFSNFGSTIHPETLKVKKAVKLTRKNHPKLIVEGELQADVSVNGELMKMLFPFSKLDGAADILIFPDLNSANISYKLLSQLSDVDAIGPIMAHLKKSANILQRTTDVNGIVNMSYLTALLSME
ncbi:MAG: NADP-dependent malic enzyme [Bacteriovoracales bacterium]